MKKLLVSLLAAALVIPALACGGDDDGAQASGSQPTQAAAQPTQPSAAQPTQRPSATGTAASGSGNELSGFGRNLRQLKSFKATFVMEVSGARQEGTIEVVVPDKYHLTLAGIEYIGIGTDAYFKAGPTWIKAPAGAGNLGFSPETFTGLAEGLAQAAEAGQNVTKGGTDTVNGTSCQVYTVVFQGGSNEVCVANDLPLRIVTTTSGFKYTLLLSDFDRVPDIKAPI